MDGFDKAYEQVKELIGNLSYAEDVKLYAVKSSMIAYTADNGKYREEALEKAKKYVMQLLSEIFLWTSAGHWAVMWKS